MCDEHAIIQRVYKAKTDNEAADSLIGDYMPFIKAETAKFLRRSPIEGHDDELSIAMIAFHDAIVNYESGRGAFLKYAAVLMKNRLIDYQRKELRHSGVISLHTPVNDDEKELIIDTLAHWENHDDVYVTKKTILAEIDQLTEHLHPFGILLTDIPESSPRQKRTLEVCRKATDYILQDQSLLNDFLEKKRLPLAKITDACGVERKTLERHRKFIIAMLLIYTYHYEIIREHVLQVFQHITEKEVK